MVLVCLSAQDGKYLVKDDDGRVLLGPFWSTTDAERLAQNLADFHREVVSLEVNDGARPQKFRPSR